MRLLRWLLGHRRVELDMDRVVRVAYAESASFERRRGRQMPDWDAMNPMTQEVYRVVVAAAIREAAHQADPQRVP